MYYNLILKLSSTEGLPRWCSGKESTCQCRRMVKSLPAMREIGFDLWFGKIYWSREWQPTPVFLPGKSHRRRSLVGYSPWGHKESDTTERLHLALRWWGGAGRGSSLQPFGLGLSLLVNQYIWTMDFIRASQSFLSPQVEQDD